MQVFSSLLRLLLHQIFLFHPLFEGYVFSLSLSIRQPPVSASSCCTNRARDQVESPPPYIMPRQELPPTPASSTEIKGKDGGQFSTLQMSFELPPPAVAGSESRPSSASTKASSTSSYHPTSPKSPAIPASEVVKIRRRSSMAHPPNKDVFALPPPPTRSRKIIQMKPRGQDAQTLETFGASETMSGKSNAAPAPKKKQPSSTSVAGRKIARKTAHSLIERRRRSKMNEEFGVLKDLIPACTGEMHKLAILQVSDLSQLYCPTNTKHTHRPPLITFDIWKTALRS